MLSELHNLAAYGPYRYARDTVETVIRSNFQRISKVFHSAEQRPELDRLRRVHFKDDMIQQITREFQYLKDKTMQILKERENKIITNIQTQWIHSQELKDIIDHIELMRDGKIYEEGLKVVLPMMNKGVQDQIAKYEKEKIRIVMNCKESVNQIKTVLDGLFYIGNKYQLDQHDIAVKDYLSPSELDLKKSEDRLFQSAVISSKPVPDIKMATNTYSEFVDSLYPPRVPDYVQVYQNYPVQQYAKQEQFEHTDQFELYGVIDHPSYVHSATRLRNGQIVSCAKAVCFFDYPNLKLITQTALNQDIKQLVEISPSLIALLAKDNVHVYEKRTRWIPKGEFITPHTGNIHAIFLQGDIFGIMCQTQLLLYRLKQNISSNAPIEYMLVNIAPNVYMHKHDCLSVAFYDLNTHFYSGDSGGCLYRWRVDNVFSVQNVIQGHQSEIIGIVPISDGRVVSMSIDGLIKLWETTLTSTIPITVIKHRTGLSAVMQFTRDPNTFFTGDISGRIQKYRVNHIIEAQLELEAHHDQITHLSFNQYLISSSADKKVKLWIV